MADVKQMVYIRPPYSHHWHVIVCPTVAPRLVFWQKKSVSCL